MITGAFSLRNAKNKDVGAFYKKTFNKIGTHTIIFSILYFLWHYFLKLYGGENIISALKEPLIMQLKGWNGHPLWYMYTLFGIYLLVPYIVQIREKYIGTKKYHICAVLYCIWAFISLYFEDAGLAWSVPKVFCFLGFVILGDEIRCFFENKGNNITAYATIILGFGIYILEYIILYNTGDYHTKYLSSIAAPLSILGITIIFAGTTMLKISFNFNITVKYSFYIYLIHRWVLDIINSLLLNYITDYKIYIPLAVLLTAGISLVLSIIYVKLFDKLKRFLPYFNAH